MTDKELAEVQESNWLERKTNEWWARVTDPIGSTLNILRSLGPLLVSQVDSASEAHVRHMERLAAVEAGKEIVRLEVTALSDIKKQLRQRYYSVEPGERVRIKRDIEDIDKNLRILRVGARALFYTVEAFPKGEPSAASGGKPEISEVKEHWFDRFRDFACNHNEPWREDLLARALAEESTMPGSVPPRILWLLGTLEERQFMAFAELLNLCAVVGGALVAPGIKKELGRTISDCSLNPKPSCGTLMYGLADSGLIADIQSAQLTISKGVYIKASYADRSYLIDCRNHELAIRGLMFTPLGSSLAKFCSRSTRALGEEIFEAWLKSLNAATHPRRELTQEQVNTDGTGEQ